ncbi:MAG: N-acetylglutaminylglutamine synthetase [Rhodospirillales bacterium]
MSSKNTSLITAAWPDQASLKNWGDLPEPTRGTAGRNVAIDCGWGRLIFGQTFDTAGALAETLMAETSGRRDVAFYVREPHVVLAAAPQSLFLDPSHTYRRTLTDSVPEPACPDGLSLRRARAGDARQINRLYRAWMMVSVPPEWLAAIEADGALDVLVAEERGDGGETSIAGVVMGVDHVAAFDDPDNGASLWALAVDPQAGRPGIGRFLVEALSARFAAAGRAFMDLSVMHDNEDAIRLYEQLEFERVPVYAVKRKNPINERLFVGPGEENGLNIYADLIVREARRRGIMVDIEDSEAGLIRLSHGGRSIACRESLSDLTSAVALSRCDDKALTRRLLARAGLQVPDQMSVGDDRDGVAAFLETHRRVVVKPARGEQGRGVFVDLRTLETVEGAISEAQRHCDHVIIEQMVAGDDLRVIVIGNEVVAAAVRRPPEVRGDGRVTIRDLIEKQSRRRQSATDGESSIPLDDETRRCVADAGYDMEAVLDDGETLVVRKTANLHTGGTIHDVTDVLHPSLRSAAVAAARELEIPVVGFDFVVGDPQQSGYAIIEANERPGLANHEPQPTAERFIDLLFPQTISPVDQKRDRGERAVP